MGAVIAGLDTQLQNKFYNFGVDLGLLFQIQDDIIDETATSDEAGKTTSNDGAKNSFVNLLGLEGALKSADILANKCQKTLDNFENNQYLQELLKKYIYRHN